MGLLSGPGGPWSEDRCTRLEIDAIPVEVRRNSRRRTRIGLAFDPSGVVILDAPLDATDDELRAVVVEHGRWLRHRLERVREEAVCVSAPSYASGELLQYLGEAYELAVKPVAAPADGSEGVARPGVRRIERNSQLALFPDTRGISGRIEVTAPDTDRDAVRSQIRRWYSDEARRTLAASLGRFSGLPWLDGTLPPWRTRYMSSQWGSCSAAGRLALNTHLVKVPERLIDYVVLHELCHLVHHDHSRRFYGLMSGHMPDWSDRRDALQRYVPVLMHD